jgi:hypothetical protein
MNTRNFIFSIIVIINLIAGCHSVPDKTKANFDFKELTFHSSFCFGTCPQISMNIRKDKSISLSRGIPSSFNLDTAISGNYKGYLKDADFNNLITELQQVNWDTLKFNKRFCCDGSVKTLIISYNGKHKKFKSMFPPSQVNGLINYLVNLGSRLSLPRYGKPIDFEE